MCTRSCDPAAARGGRTVYSRTAPEVLEGWLGSYSGSGAIPA